METDNTPENNGLPQAPPATGSKQAATSSEPPPATLGPQPFTDYLIHQLKTMEDRVKTLESQKAASTTNAEVAADSKAEFAADPKAEVAADSETEVAADSETKAKLTPTVRWCNWEQFKNTFSDDEGNHSIDVLVAGQQIKDDVRQEITRRLQADDGTYNNATTLPSFSSNGNRSQWMRYLRIKSKIVLSIIERISGRYGLYHLGADRPGIFVEPFKSLIFVHEELKREFQTLPRKTEGDPSHDFGTQVSNLGDEKPVPVISKDVEKGTDKPPPTTAETDKSSTTPAKSEPSGAAMHASAPAHLKEEDSLSLRPLDMDDVAELECYLKFMDEHVMPRYTQLRTGTAEMDFSKKVRHRDLWMLFQPGELVYVPPPTQVQKPKASTEQRVWRLCRFFDAAEPDWNYDRIEREHYSSLGRKKEKRDSEDTGDNDNKELDEDKELLCYYLDYTGTTFCPVDGRFFIEEFEGEVDITALKAYPLRFLPDQEETKKKLKAERAQFVSYAKDKRQVLYDGWSIVKNIHGEPISETPQNQQYIDSEVIVDFDEAYQSNPWWKPQFFWNVYRMTPTTAWKTDNFPVVHWKDPQRSSRLSEDKDLFQVRANVEVVETCQWAEKDRFLTLGSYHATNEPPRYESLHGDEVLLLPTRVFAYSFRDRKFFQIDIRRLKEIEKDQDPFSSLQINPGHKETIESLLHTHFGNKSLDKGPGDAIPNQDLIRGKGRGIVILLHGAPGVGKTATAEAVAQKHERPLFSISCGDLGYQPDNVESALTEIFRLAQVWNCILLLDEADVFLTQRSINDLKRNAMVSTILRILEYYKGVLFLTTNRPGALDEALKSRVHVSLHYPPLDGDKMEEIFKINLDRLEMIEKRRGETTNSPGIFPLRKDILQYAKTHFQRYGHSGMGSWNGRQIRNAFQVASAMARYEGIENPGAQMQLRASHFEKVAEATRQYDEFRKNTLKKTDPELAKSNKHRDDGYVFSPEGAPMGHGSYQGQYGGAYPIHQGQQSNLAQSSSPYIARGPPHAEIQNPSQQWSRPPVATGSPALRSGQLQGGYNSHAMNSMPPHMQQSTPDKSQPSFPGSVQPTPWNEPYHGREAPMMQTEQIQMGHSGQPDY